MGYVRGPPSRLLEGHQRPGQLRSPLLVALVWGFSLGVFRRCKSFQRSQQLDSASPIPESAVSLKTEEARRLAPLQVFSVFWFRRLEILVFVLLLVAL